AGQRNFPIVLTNRSERTCTVRGYPGAAFVDASGTRLGPDPKRSPDTATAVSLAPRASAWAGLTYASPEISGARTALPAALLVTPPDEREPLRAAWTGGEVPVAGQR
ncbi:lipoprotein, partial [Streptomyces zinciresistens K42]